ncbi:serine/threonine protein kinase [Bremerella sp.]|uniref:serine/threonine protein kinase n=1 Tax=Bremerella sp. TaxID=2795602 RepID=UPI0039194F57
MTIDVNWLGPKFSNLSGLQVLSSGGQKWVFSANDHTHGEIVLKLIKPSSGDVEHTEREILAVQTINSKRVPRVLEHGVLDTQLGNCLWILEPLVNGPTVQQMITFGPLRKEQYLKLGLQMLEALKEAEDVAIVHRDVKPGNIMCDQAGDFWLLDFGLARHQELSSLTPTASPYGKFTPGYAPPEQFKNHKREIDARADLFGLGVTLYECVTGNNPYWLNARDAMDVLHRVETMTLPPLSLSFRAGNSFRDLVAAMTQRRREHRPSSIADALDWMSDICFEESV